jgi:hypothetical protein
MLDRQPSKDSSCWREPKSEQRYFVLERNVGPKEKITE